MLRPYFLLYFLFVQLLSTAQNQDPPILDFSQLQPYLQKNNDTIYVVNFWATWCKPCVEELPYIEQLHEDTFPHPVEILLVSLDFRNQVQDKLIPFIRDKMIRSDVVVLDDPDANSWIDKVDPRWSGAIPATLIYHGEEKLFFPEGFENYQTVKEIISNF